MKVTKVSPNNTVTFKTKDVSDVVKGVYRWWLAGDDKALCNQVLTTASYLKESQSYLYRQTAIYARLYGNISLFNFAGNNTNKMDNQTGLPSDRPTFNLIQSCVDTAVSRIGQNKPSPTFLTDNSDYKERRLAKQLNNFILGEFYQTKAYDKAVIALRDALVTGDGILKVYETEDNKVAIDRVLRTELLVDANDGMYGDPRQIFQLKLVDREVLMAMSPKYKKIIELAATAFPDNSSDSAKTIADQVMVVEAWHLPSGKNAKDGRHVIACSSGILLDEEYNKDKFPFVFLKYSPRLMGFWAQGMAEQLMGTQLEINSLLYTISKAIKLVGVPRVFVEEGSKVTKASFNNEVGSIIMYRGVKPSYEVAPAVPQELYGQLQRTIDYGFQQCGISMMQATSQKPAGLNSGEAIRSYDDINTDRMATLAKRYDNLFIDLSYLIVDLAKDIATREGKYQTVYPNKDGTKQIDLPDMSLIEDPFVIQVFNQSSLPKDPAGRMQKVTEMIQGGMISIKEGRRLLDYPDLEQVEKLANSSEERIYKILDQIVEDGIYTPPDPFMDLQLANDLVVQYYNLYVSCKLEEDRAQMLRDFFDQVQTLKQAAMPPQTMAPGAPGASPAAAPEALPSSPLVPNGNPAGAQ
jgi:hypothetical protein